MELSNHIEALLFLSGEPIKFSRLSKIFDKDENEIKKAVEETEDRLKNSGIRLMRKDDEIMLATSPESSKYCELFVKEELNKNIGRAGLETLAIIIYKNEEKDGGVSRSEIDNIRGVNSGFTLRNLMIRGFIDRKINPKDKRSFAYSPTIKLFQYLGVYKKIDLPEFETILNQMENASQDTENL
ncbi:MAG: SMC-Scp complex subunit ScpB [Candidatus Pacebacteria bacterium]|nr:SMC-Scp complex subunit ScpB [Candidatus Paceibacterota bacterium]